jgi:hypothetical protein
MRRLFQLLLTGPLLLGVMACGGKKDELDQLDTKLTSKVAPDPALTAALEDQIMVDPTLSSQSNDHAIKPPAAPMQTPILPQAVAKPAIKPTAPIQTLGSLASAQAEIAKDSFNGCGLNVQYSMSFAARLPADFPLYPKSQVAEAAGSDDNGCRLRAITVNTAAPVKDVADHYASIGSSAGYSVGTKQGNEGTLITGKRAADGGAFYVILSSVAGGTSADLVINNGK